MASELDLKLRRYLGKQLRRLYSRSPIKPAVYARDRLPCGAWKCVECGFLSSDRKLFDVEHASPVVPVDIEYQHSLDYFMRMFGLTSSGQVELSNLRLFCKQCHRQKSTEEIKQRAANKTGPWSEAAKARRKKRHEQKKHRNSKRKPSRRRVSSR